MSHPAAAPPEFLQLAGHPLRWRLLAELAAGPYGSCNLASRMPVDTIGVDVDVYHDGHVTIAALDERMEALDSAAELTRAA